MESSSSVKRIELPTVSSEHVPAAKHAKELKWPVAYDAKGAICTPASADPKDTHHYEWADGLNIPLHLKKCTYPRRDHFALYPSKPEDSPLLCKFREKKTNIDMWHILWQSFVQKQYRKMDQERDAVWIESPAGTHVAFEKAWPMDGPRPPNVIVLYAFSTKFNFQSSSNTEGEAFVVDVPELLKSTEERVCEGRAANQWMQTSNVVIYLDIGLPDYLLRVVFIDPMEESCKLELVAIESFVRTELEDMAESDDALNLLFKQRQDYCNTDLRRIYPHVDSLRLQTALATIKKLKTAAPKRVAAVECNTCGKPFEPAKGKEWAKQCLACYKKEKGYSSMTASHAGAGSKCPECGVGNVKPPYKLCYKCGTKNKKTGPKYTRVTLPSDFEGSASP